MSESGDKQISQNKLGGRKTLLLLAVIFVLPFTLAAILHLLNLQPEGHSYGDLVKPPHRLTFPILHDAQNKEFKAPQWLKKWSIVIVDSTACAEPCQAKVHMLRQVHVSLGKEFKRIQRVLLVSGNLKPETLSGLQKQNPDLVILAGTDADTIAFADVFKQADKMAVRVYLVDPLGNLMMRYPENIDPKGLRSDLTKLLKNSWAG